MDPTDTFIIDTNDITYEYVCASDTITSSIDNIIIIDDQSWIVDWETDSLWRDICKHAENNSALHQAIERVKILYYLSKEDGNSET
jgi:S-adenosylmethionine:diacylglycerol 3-amino-3-carboxypropyl transferase